VKKYDTARQATDYCTIRSRIGMICMTDDQGKNTNTTNNVEYILLFHGDNGYANVPHCYIIRYIAFLVKEYVVGEKACYAFNHRSIWDMHITVWKLQIMFFTQTKRQYAKL